jgi:hypothetical protein
VGTFSFEYCLSFLVQNMDCSHKLHYSVSRAYKNYMVSDLEVLEATVVELFIVSLKNMEILM